MRSVADGQSQNSFTNTSMRYLGGSNAYASDLVNSRPGKLTQNIITFKFCNITYQTLKFDVNCDAQTDKK